MIESTTLTVNADSKDNVSDEGNKVPDSNNQNNVKDDSSDSNTEIADKNDKNDEVKENKEPKNISLRTRKY